MLVDPDFRLRLVISKLGEEELIDSETERPGRLKIPGGVSVMERHVAVLRSIHVYQFL